MNRFNIARRSIFTQSAVQRKTVLSTPFQTELGAPLALAVVAFAFELTNGVLVVVAWCGRLGAQATCCRKLKCNGSRGVIRARTSCSFVRRSQSARMCARRPRILSTAGGRASLAQAKVRSTHARELCCCMYLGRCIAASAHSICRHRHGSLSGHLRKQHWRAVWQHVATVNQSIDWVSVWCIQFSICCD